MPYFLVPSLPVCSPRAHRIQSFRLIYFLWSSYTNWCIFLNVVNFNHKPIQFYLHRYINIDVCPWCLQCCCCRGRARAACVAASAPTQGTPWQGKISFLDNDFLYSILTNYLNPFMQGGGRFTPPTVVSCSLLKKSAGNPYVKILDLYCGCTCEKIYKLSFIPSQSTYGTPSTKMIFFCFKLKKFYEVKENSFLECLVSKEGKKVRGVNFWRIFRKIFKNSIRSYLRIFQAWHPQKFFFI